MQIIKSLTKLLFFICPFFATAQSTYLQQGDKAYQLLERLEIKGKINQGLNFSNIKYLNRKFMVQEAMLLDSLQKVITANPAGTDSLSIAYKNLHLSKIDQYNLQRFFMNNSEWFTGNKESFVSKKPVLNAFYKTQANLFEVNTKDFFLAVNPVLQLAYGKESGFNDKIFVNTRGITARGMIANKIGFSTTITENQERGPSYFRQKISSLRAVPGYGFFKGFKTSGVDYFDARGYITFNVAKYVDVQFGHDKNFIGNGYRSLFLSDWGNSYLFLKLNTKVWKFNYQNIFMELMPTFFKIGGDKLLSKKYQVMHHLSFNVSKSVSIGVFEAITFGRKDHVEFQYLNPIIFLRHVESSQGSADKAKAGFDFKANVANKLQFYGQFLLDEFVLNKLRNDPSNYVNKYGYQLGVKYVDAFGIANLDLQVETNRVRPFTFSHRDSISTYTHYNQPMAHPLGANFHELIGILKYQPMPKLYVYGRAIYYYQGLDSARFNFGASPFRLYSEGLPLVDPANPLSAQRTNGFTVGSGNKATCLNAMLQLSYEVKENIYFDFSLQHRTFKLENSGIKTNSTLFSAGIRMNIVKREYDF
jgi:hypothetical protein